MEPRRPSPIKPPDHKELTKQEPTPMVRQFLFQSIGSRELPADVSIEDMQFTRLMLVKRVTPDGSMHLLPLTGRMRPQEKTTTATARIAHDKTHLRCTPGTQTIVEDAQSFIIAGADSNEPVLTDDVYNRLLPADTPYALHQETDHLKGFTFVTLQEWQALCNPAEGVETVPAAVPLVENLQSAAEGIDPVHQRTEAYWKITEAHKKGDMLLHLFSLLQHNTTLTAEQCTALKAAIPTYTTVIRCVIDAVGNPRQRDRLVNGQEIVGDIALDDGRQHYETTAEEVSEVMETLWQEVTATYPVTHELLQEALYRSNSEAIVRYNRNPKESIEENQRPSLMLLLPLLLERLEPDAGIKNARFLAELSTRYPEFKEIWEIAGTMIATMRRPEVTAENYNATVLGKLKQRFKDSKNPLVSTMLELFDEQETDGRYMSHLAKFTDEFFDHLFAQANITDTNSLTIHPEIQAVNDCNADPDRPKKQTRKDVILYRLMEYAGGRPMPEGITDDQEQRIVRWEAARKIILMALLKWVQKERGIKNMMEPITRGLDEETLFHEMQITEHIREKSTESWLRKILSRDALAANIFADHWARALVFEGDEARYSPEDLALQTWTVPEGIAEMRDKQGNTITEFTAPRPVYDYLVAVGKKAFELKNNRNSNFYHRSLLITEYKPLPPQGAAIESNGPGGGGAIRYTKFYMVSMAIDTSTGQPMITEEEVQCFTPEYKPDGTFVSAQANLDHKKNDDIIYAMLRAFETNNLRSLIELLWPGTYYGDDARILAQGKNRPALEAAMLAAK